MKKRMIIMLVGVGILFGGIVGYKTFSNFMLNKFLASRENIATVSAMIAETAPWHRRHSRLR